MKKFWIVLINIFLFVLCFHIADFYALFTCKQFAWFYASHHGNKLVNYIKFYNDVHSYRLHFDNGFKEFLLSDKYAVQDDEFLWWKYIYRRIENPSANKSILLFGCSYAYGVGIKYNETFSYALGNVLKDYRIYNRAIGGATTSHMLYQLENKDFSNIPNVKCVIYLFISDHFVRNHYIYYDCPTPYYSEKPNLHFLDTSFKYIKTPLTYNIREYNDEKFKSHLYKGDKNLTNQLVLTRELIKKSVEQSKRQFGDDVKFVVLRYDNGRREAYNWFFEDLKKDGCIVLSINDLEDKNFFTLEYEVSEDDVHPNAKAWQELTPILVKTLQRKEILNN